MKIFILGGSGYVGSLLADFLVANNHLGSFVLVDKFDEDPYQSVCGVLNSADVKFINSDLSNFTDVQKLKDTVNCGDVIFHFAASAVMSDFSGSHMKEHYNYTITSNIVDLARSSGAYLIFASSTSVYQGFEGAVDEMSSIANTPPQSPYAQSKYREELLIQKELDKFIILRLGTVSGRGRKMNFATAINKFCRQAHIGDPLTFWSSAENQSKPYLSVIDLTSVLGATLDGNLSSGEIYNVVSEHCTISEIFEKIKQKWPSCKIEKVCGPPVSSCSQEVSVNKLIDQNFVFSGSVDQDIESVYAMLTNDPHK